MSENAQKCPKGNTKPLGKNQRNRSFVLTSFLDTPPFYDEDKCKYLLYAPEVCPDTGRKHWQGYVYFYDKKSLKQAQKILKCPQVHFEVAMSEDVEHQKDYIIGPYEKDGKVKPHNPEHKVFGNEPNQGKRSDLIELKDKILTGELSCDNIITEMPEYYHQYGRTLDKLEDLRMSKLYRTEMTKGIWYHGATGTGKSHEAFKGFNPDTHYVLPDDNGWWDNYKQQETVIINDFRGRITYNEMLQLVDKWPYQVKRRGRPPLPFTSKRVIVTSSLHPASVYCNRNEEDSLEQLYRRFELIYLTEKPNIGC